MTDHVTRSPEAPDPAAFTAFYDRSVTEVFRYFYKAGAGDRRLAEDLTQETFMAAVRAFQSGHVETMTINWLIVVARHKLIDHYRRRSREERKLTLAWSEQSVHDDESPLGFAVDEAEALTLLDCLSPIHRLVLVLRYLDDLAVSEVAESIGRSVSATESILVRARQSLSRKLREVHDA
ncbi:MAG: polymerase sigma-70 factor, subfamily [Ilumatobacteraceae bacterium]|jgi:RNA polymerase sigma-70 factor (ECF subfamily)